MLTVKRPIKMMTNKYRVIHILSIHDCFKFALSMKS
jgi:hypothetical protein